MKRLFASGFISALYLSASTITYAASPTVIQPCGVGVSGTGSNPLCNLGINQLIGPGITFAFVVAILVALGFLIWGGLKWILSQGDKNAVETAKQHIIAAIIGLVIIFLSYLILNLALSFFNISISNLQLPTINSTVGTTPVPT